MSDLQKTLKEEIAISGIGLHTGEKVNMTLKPAPEDHGYVFQRIDLPEKPLVKADLDNVVSTKRGTTLEKNGAAVNTTEHVLAALYGLEVDNALIELDGPEIPILDGSSRLFVEAIQKTGIVDQAKPKNYFVLNENVAFENNEKQVEMLAVPTPQGEFRITVMVDYQSPLLGTQHASMYHIGEFATEISKCRTFVFLRELIQLVNNGLIKGGDVANAIVMVDTNISEEEKERLASTFNRDKSELQKIGIGILNNVELQYENEPARHKLLDIVGDLALIGRPFKGHILAARPGHQTNVEFGKMLRKIMLDDEKNNPKFDLHKEAVYDINRITKMLPHRYPFLLIDKIIDVDENYITGVKNVTRNEPFFDGHFPEEPVMPGVLQIEAMAQVGGIFALHNVEDPERYSTYFLKIDNVRFKQKVIPGDAVVFHLTLLSPIRRGIVHMEGKAYVRNKLVFQAEMMAQVIKNK
jgi:UDP-3-O-[3-hydroxymyristoyl] N-acetylglucosamine deacetylase / 3-hydroxyacyl-[acyl-carrier-protein] dehydratase